MREQIIQTLEQEKIIVIVRGVEREKLIPLSEAMYAGGIRLLEITYSANGKVSDEDTAENIRLLAGGDTGLLVAVATQANRPIGGNIAFTKAHLHDIGGSRLCCDRDSGALRFCSSIATSAEAQQQHC